MQHTDCSVDSRIHHPERMTEKGKKGFAREGHVHFSDGLWTSLSKFSDQFFDFSELVKADLPLV